VIEIIEREGLIDRASELEEELYQALVGALCAVQLEIGGDETLPAKAAAACRRAGVLTRAMAGASLQVSPPLIITKEQVADMAARFREGLGSV
jgi:adenosylmethionine-8-amino-7-oxononanoate aminotransferase